MRPDGPHNLLIGRRPLRLGLATGLDDHLRLGQVATGYELRSDGVVVRTQRGGDVYGDIVVAADGVGSVIASQAAGRPTSLPIGLVGLAGCHHDVAAMDTEAPAFLRHGPGLAFGPRGVGLFLTRHDPRASAMTPVVSTTAALEEGRGSGA